MTDPAEVFRTKHMTETLLARVQQAIGHTYPDDARAAILEVAAWMRENDTGHNAVRWLEMEANNHRSQEGFDRG